jgi:hypothetical protein
MVKEYCIDWIYQLNMDINLLRDGYFMVCYTYEKMRTNKCFDYHVIKI